MRGDRLELAQTNENGSRLTFVRILGSNANRSQLHPKPMSNSKLSTELQLVAALAAMSEANLAMRSGAVAAAAICRAARCLERLAECPDLAPALRAQCDRMCVHWEAAMALLVGCPPRCALRSEGLGRPGALTGRPSAGPSSPGARIIPMRNR
jgi:hypothetical protein